MPPVSRIVPQDFWWTSPVGRDDMERVNVYSFYTIGAKVKEFSDVVLLTTEETNYRILSLYQLKTWFDLFLERSSDTTWRATRGRAKQIVALLNGKVGDDVNPFESSESLLDHAFLREFKGLLTAFESAFGSDHESSNVFSVSQKGTHASLDLMERAEDNLPPDVKERLSSEMVFDIREAGKCLALDCHTASGYHILRAVERLIIRYVEKVTGTPINPKNRNWGVYIRTLKTHNADPSVIGYLQHIKDFYRNPLIHPEDSLNGNEAFSLFNASVSAIIQLDAATEAWP